MISHTTFFMYKGSLGSHCWEDFQGMDSRVGFPGCWGNSKVIKISRVKRAGHKTFFFQGQKEGAVASHSQVYSKYKTGSKSGVFVGVSFQLRQQLAVKLSDNWSNYVKFLLILSTQHSYLTVKTATLITNLLTVLKNYIECQLLT